MVEHGDKDTGNPVSDSEGSAELAATKADGSRSSTPMIHKLFSEGTMDKWQGGAYGTPPPVPASSPHPDGDAELADISRETLGQCRLLERLGEGGMGVVYRAAHKTSGAIYAIKVLKAAQHAKKDEIDRFRSEVAVLTRLDHPSICRFIEQGHEDNLDYFVMELIDGVALDRWLEREAPGIDRVLRLLIKVADAVDFANDRGVIHRDINPNNIMVYAGDQPIVMDFGLSRDLNSDQRLTISGVAIGTPPFMSPEATFGKAGTLGPWTDVWGLGAVAYFCLTGFAPYSGASNQEIFLKINEDEAPSARSKNDRIPLPVDRIVRRCMQKVPGDRYACASAIALDLQRHLDGETVVVQLPGLVKRFTRFLTKHPRASMSVSALLVVVLTLGVFLAADYYRRWAGWRTVAQLDVTAQDLRPFKVYNGGLTMPRGYTAKEQGIGLEPIPPNESLAVGFLALRVPGSHRGVRLDLTWQMPQDDAIEVALNSRPVHLKNGG